MKHAFTVMTYDHGHYTHQWVSMIIPVPDNSESSIEETGTDILQFMVFSSRLDAVNRRQNLIKLGAHGFSPEN